MSGVRGVPDPYRELGVSRGANEEDIKAAYRRLAKRFHPDSADGDQVRFLAVQQAYLVLSDPIRRRDWDSRHAPGPVRATERPVAPRPPATRAPTWGPTSGPGSPVQPPTRPGNPYSMPPAAGPRATSGARPPAGPPRTAPPGMSPNDRDPASRSTTWSARGVPWWEDFRADGVTRGGGPPTGAAGSTRPTSGTGSAPPGGAPSGPGQPARPFGPGTPGAGAPGPGTPGQGPGAGDIFAKSSGAAWSSAARRHFRKDEADLPRGGSFRYRGTQVVTGGEARMDAAAEARRAATPPPPAGHAPPQMPPRPGPSQPAPTTTSGLMSRLRKLLGGG